MDEKNSTNLSLRGWLSFALSPAIKTRHRRELSELIPCSTTLDALLQHAIDPHSIDLSKLAIEVDTIADVEPFLSRHLSHKATQQRCEQALSWAFEDRQHHIVSLASEHYPDTLAMVPDAPPILYVRGQPQALQEPLIAIVGSRKATPGGRAQAYEVAADLAKAGVGTVSGLAKGIDAAAHTGSLEAKAPTVAVAATAPDKVYPAAHRELAAKIAGSGAVISEFPLGSSLRPGCFPRRNRIISGLSLAVLVVEATIPSGTLTTALHALNQGREVMAMPGSVKNPQVTGCHTLIREGGILITGADDILAAVEAKLRPLLRTQIRPTVKGPVGEDHVETASQSPSLTQDAQELLALLGFNPMTIDELVEASALKTAQVTGALMQLELKGFVSTEGTGRYVRC
ncbi:MAG: DNA-processing protein DprA [Gammaproteobacteria bacterium]|nr:DNA-processing protein DprA [Gammaproteobacteria bacterium]